MRQLLRMSLCERKGAERFGAREGGRGRGECLVVLTAENLHLPIICRENTVTRVEPRPTGDDVRRRTPRGGASDRKFGE